MGGQRSLMEQATNFVLKVKNEFESDPTVYEEFYRLLLQYKWETQELHDNGALQPTQERLEKLFLSHNKQGLAQEFRRLYRRPNASC